MKALRTKKSDTFSNGELTKAHMKKGSIKHKIRVHIEELNFDIFVDENTTLEKIEEIKLKYLRNARIK